MLRYEWSVETHVGLVRTVNEDSFSPTTDGIDDGPLIVAVADGMGGHAAGDVASRTAIDAAIPDEVVDEMDPAQRVRLANTSVIDAITADPRLAGMGTTLTFGVFTTAGVLHIAHVGDSRAYLLRNNKLRQITTDHTVVAALVARGHITEQQARNHPQRHLVTQSIGMHDIDIERIDLELKKGDVLLFCSDGLSAMIDDDGIKELLEQRESLSDATWGLVTAANAAGGFDNTTVAVVEVHED